MDNEIGQRVITNHLILEIIFSHLRLSDLKICRLVCQQWTAVSLQHLIDSSVFGINSSSEPRVVKQPQLQHFIANFLISSPIHYKHLMLQGTFKAAQMESFFRHRRFIEELTLNSLYMKDTPTTYLQCYDLSAWSYLKLTALTVDRGGHLLVPLRFLGTIKTLSLQNVTVELDGRIAPITLNWDRVIYVKGGRGLKSNDRLDLLAYIDPCNLKELKCTRFGFIEVEVHLDLTQCPRLESLQINFKHVVGWSHKLILKRLGIDPHGYEGCIRLPDILKQTSSVQELNLEFKVTDLLSTYNYDRIKSLMWVGREHLHQNLKISAFPNLIRLEINGFVCLDLSTLPISMKVIKISGNCGKWKLKGKAACQLDKLIVEVSSSEIVEQIAKAVDRLNAKAVVVMLQNRDICRNVLKLASQKGILNGRTFVMGRARWITEGKDSRSDRVHNKCPLLRQLFHMRSDYIVCCGGEIVKGICKTEYEDWVQGYEIIGELW